MSQTTSTINKAIQTIKQHRGIIITAVVILLLIFLWNPVIRPLLDNVAYNDDGEFSGQPVYYGSENRISKTLHEDLKKCGFSDNDVEKLIQESRGWGTVGNSRVQDRFDANGKPTVTIVITNLTRDATEIGLYCQ